MRRRPRRPPPSALELRARASGCPPRPASIGIGMPMRPVEQTSTSAGAQPSAVGGELAHAQRVGAARLPGRGVGVAGVEDDRGGAAVGEVAAADLHRRGLREVRREHAGRGDRRVGRRWRRCARSGAPDSLMPDATREPDPPRPSNAPGDRRVTLTAMTPARVGRGRWSRAGRARGWRPGSPGPTRPSPGCRARRSRARCRCARRSGR